MAEGEQQHLQWDNFHLSLASHFHGFLEQGELVDVTIAAGDGRVRAHRLLLSACSPYLKRLLEASPCEHPVLILEDVGRQELMSLLEFMYRGEVHVEQGQLEAFLQAAETLQVKGLTGCQRGKGIADDIDADAPDTPKQDSPKAQSDVDDESNAGHGGRQKQRRVARKRKRTEDASEQPSVASKGARTQTSLSGEEDASSGTNGETEFLVPKPEVELVDVDTDPDVEEGTGTHRDEASCRNYFNTGSREYLVVASDGLQLIQRQRGYPQLVYGNFIFNCQLYEGVHVYWVCQDNYKFNCRASVVTVHNKVVNTYGARHNHDSHQQEVEDEMLKGNFRVLPLRKDMFLHVHSSGRD